MCYRPFEAVQQSALCFFRYRCPDSGLPEAFRPRRSWGRRSWVALVRQSEAAAACGDFRRADLYYWLARDLYRAGGEVCGTNPAFEGLWQQAHKRITSNFIE